jgi:valyl-tRNA synthetase
MSDLPDSYDPDTVEPKWREQWQETDVYAYEGGSPDYVIDTPPP